MELTISSSLDLGNVGVYTIQCLKQGSDENMNASLYLQYDGQDARETNCSLLIFHWLFDYFLMSSISTNVIWLSHWMIWVS